jgi:branched-chain amino acid transport system permease protein
MAGGAAPGSAGVPPALASHGESASREKGAGGQPALPGLPGFVRVNALPLVLFVIFALVPFGAALTSEAYVLNLVTRVMIFAIAAIALDLLAGCGALVSFGHAAFIGIGAYAVGILAAHGVNDALVSLPAALGASALFAWATGIVCLRTKGVYFIMITLAFGQMAFFTASSLAPYGGDDGLTISARSTLAGLPILADDRALYGVTLACLGSVYLLCRALAVSRFGRVYRGARENAARMSAIGFEVFDFRLAAYVIAGMIAGLAGFLLANLTNFVSPAYMAWQRSGDLLVMVVLGGMGTLHGAILGAAVFLLTEEWLGSLLDGAVFQLAAWFPDLAGRLGELAGQWFPELAGRLKGGFAEHWKLVFGPLLVLVAVFARGGLIGVALRLRRAFRG